VTTFHPEPGLIGRISPLVAQVARVLVVDNGSSTPEQSEIRALQDRGDVEVKWNERNLGLSAALNAGLAWAIERGASWALLLDQDSEAGPDVVTEVARVLRLAGSDNVAVIGAGFLGRDASAADSPGWEEASVVITSGMLVSVAAWRAIGGFRSDFFVDYVDLEFCLRARADGYRVLRSIRPTIRHSIGDPRQRRLLWRSVTVTNHDTSRRYEITRNRVVVWGAYWRQDSRFVITDMVAFVKESVKVVLFEAERRGRLHAIGRGFRDGLKAPPRAK